jgi:hypothetical protein
VNGSERGVAGRGVGQAEIEAEAEQEVNAVEDEMKRLSGAA